MAISSNIVSDNNIELEPLNKQNPGGLLSTPKMKRGGTSKKIQFTTPEFSVTPISALPGSNNRMLLPNRRR